MGAWRRKPTNARMEYADVRSQEETIYLVMQKTGVLKYCEAKISQSGSFDGVDLFFYNRNEGLWMSRKINFDFCSPHQVLDAVADVADYARRAFHTVIAMRKAGVNV